MKKIPFHQEILRKIIHLSSIWIPVTIYHLERKSAAIFFSVLSVLMFMIDYGRRHLGWLDKLFTTILSLVLRHNERGQSKTFTGATYMIFSAVLTTALFPTLIASTAFCILIISDTAAALVGRRWGKHPIFDKSIEGSSAFFLSALIVISFLGMIVNAPYSFYLAGIAGAAAATVAELFSSRLHIDDNLIIPFASGIVMLFIFFILAT